MNEENSSMSFPERLLGIFIDPVAAMEDLAARPRILFPIIAMAVSMPLLYIVRYPLLQEFLRQNMEISMQAQGVALPAEQLDAMMAWLPYFSIASAPFSELIVWLILSGIFLGVSRIFKGQGNYKQFLSVVGYAYVITSFYCLISLAVSYFTGEIQLNASLGLFFASMKGSYAYGLLRSIELFNIWYYVLIAIGVGIVSRVDQPRIYSSVAVIYIIRVVITAFSYKYM